MIFDDVENLILVEINFQKRGLGYSKKPYVNNSKRRKKQNENQFLERSTAVFCLIIVANVLTMIFVLQMLT